MWSGGRRYASGRRRGYVALRGVKPRCHFGQFAKAQELTRCAVDSAAHADDKETAASYQAQYTVREALAGNAAGCKAAAQSALEQSVGKNVEAVSAVALAMAGDSVRPKRLAGDLNHRYPKDTIVQFIYLPIINAARTSTLAPPTMPFTR